MTGIGTDGPMTGEGMGYLSDVPDVLKIKEGKGLDTKRLVALVSAFVVGVLGGKATTGKIDQKAFEAWVADKDPGAVLAMTAEQLKALKKPFAPAEAYAEAAIPPPEKRDRRVLNNGGFIDPNTGEFRFNGSSNRYNFGLKPDVPEPVILALIKAYKGFSDEDAKKVPGLTLTPGQPESSEPPQLTEVSSPKEITAENWRKISYKGIPVAMLEIWPREKLMKYLKAFGINDRSTKKEFLGIWTDVQCFVSKENTEQFEKEAAQAREEAAQAREGIEQLKASIAQKNDKIVEIDNEIARMLKENQ